MMTPQKNKAIIQIDAVTKQYQLGGETIKALNQISLTIERGEFVAIIGPSGSGKSTLMNVIGCLDTPTSGTYKLDGHEIGRLNDNQLAEIRNQKVGFIFQGFNLLAKMTAQQNVELPLIYRGVSAKERERLALDALRKVGLLDRKSHRPNELSGGQQQRVAIARALAGNPPILLADEPTGALDSKTGADVIRLLKSLHAEGHTIVLITHDLNVANQAGRIVAIQDGQLVAEGGEANADFTSVEARS